MQRVAVKCAVDVATKSPFKIYICSGALKQQQKRINSKNIEVY